MRQHGSECDVTDALDVLLRGGELVVDDNATTVVHFNTSSLDIEAFGVGAASDCYKNDIGFKLWLY